MELVRRRQEEARDPIVHQLQALLDSSQRKEEAREPLYQKLGGLGEMMQAATQHQQQGNTQMETKILRSIEK